MAVEYLFGVDIGTTGAKAIIFDGDGNSLGSGYFEYTCTYPKPSWVEQDVEHIVAKSMEAARQALAAARIHPQQVSAISFSAQRCCTIPLDGDGRLVRPMISWQDNRTAEEVEEIAGKITAERFYHITLLPLNTTWMVSKILWLRKNEPRNWERVKKVVQLQDYALRAWGAEDYFDDLSDTCFYGLWDLEKRSWSEELLGKLDIPKNILPIPTVSGTMVGRLSRKAAEATGLQEGTRLCVGAGDQNSAAVGAGIVTHGHMSVSLGTGGLIAAYLDKPYRDPACKTMVTHHALPGSEQMEGYQAGAASVFRWFRDELAALEKTQAQAANRDPYELLNEMVASVPAGARGLLVLPYFASATSPRWNPFARGTITGLTFAHDRSCLARAFMEGITLEVKDMLLSLLASGIEISEVHILGGPTRSGIWNQIQADMYNRPVKTLKNADAAVLGAAILAGVGAKHFRDVREGAARMVKVDKVYQPEAKSAGIYDRLYDIYCLAYEGLQKSGVFQKLSELQQTIA